MTLNHVAKVRTLPGQRMNYKHGDYAQENKGNCVDCGQLVADARTKRCRSCHSKWLIQQRSAKKVERWLSGGPGGSKWKIYKGVREFLFEEANYKCTLCGWGEINPFTNSVPLQIDHINGDAEDHSRNNLRIICPNCHSLTETYGVGNMGNGRSWRRYSNIRAQ